MSESPSPEIYSSPLAQRFASREMLENFSELKKFRTWRRVWVALAEAEHELGVKAVTEKQMKSCVHSRTTSTSTTRASSRRSSATT